MKGVQTGELVKVKSTGEAMRVKSVWPTGCFLTYRQVTDFDWPVAPTSFYPWSDIEIPSSQPAGVR